MISFNIKYKNLVANTTTNMRIQGRGNTTGWTYTLHYNAMGYTGTGVDMFEALSTNSPNNFSLDETKYNGLNTSYGLQIRMDYYTGTIELSNFSITRYYEETYEYTAGEKIGTLPRNLTESGYKFIGWYTEKVGGTQISSDSLVPPINTTYYAHWSKN